MLLGDCDPAESLCEGLDGRLQHRHGLLRFFGLLYEGGLDVLDGDFLKFEADFFDLGLF